jgi:hypothetical protein
MFSKALHFLDINKVHHSTEKKSTIARHLHVNGPGRQAYTITNTNFSTIKNILLSNL